MTIWPSELIELPVLYEFLKGKLFDPEKDPDKLIHADDEQTRSLNTTLRIRL